MPELPNAALIWTMGWPRGREDRAQKELIAAMQLVFAGGKANPAGGINRRDGPTCTGCGGIGHTAAKCYHRDKVCRKCSQKRHLASGCKQGSGSGSSSTLPSPETKATCKCCGNRNHTKTDCSKRDQACANCQQIGHTQKVCTASVPKPGGGVSPQCWGPELRHGNALHAASGTQTRSRGARAATSKG